MKIIELRAENFKRLKAVRITPDGSLCQISGRNAQGKSSILDSVWAALGGKDAAPARPIRKGESSALVSLDLGDIRVTRKWTADDRSTLLVESKDGLRYPSPQAVLDKLVGQLTFDPLGFSRMDTKTSTTTLRALVGLDTSKEDAERARLYADRTMVNRDLKRVEGQLELTPEVEAPDAEVSIAELVAEHRDAGDLVKHHTAVRAALEAQREAFALRKSAIAEIKDGIEKLKVALAAAERELVELEHEGAKQKAIVAALVDPDLEAIAARMKEAEAVNGKVRAKKKRAEIAAEMMATSARATSLTEQIDAVDARKAAALAAAKFPVEGLSIADELVTFNGIPLEQASSAEQLRVGLAMGSALNPKLRVVLVRDGSLLDSDGMRLVAEWAEKEGMQVLMERVANDGEGAGVVIEDGEVAGAPAIVVAETPAAEAQP